MAQPIFRSAPMSHTLLSQIPRALAAKFKWKWWILTKSFELWRTEALVTEWLYPRMKKIFHIIEAGMRDIRGHIRNGFDFGDYEHLFPDPKGPEYRFENDLAQTEGTIRILEILKGRHEDIIVCRIHTVPLSYRPRYEALSYSWGDSDPLCPIGIQSRNMAWTPTNDGDASQYDRIFNLHPNLRSALRYMRYTDASRYIWADFVCINQKNTYERSHQVALMHEVYSRADKTLIWLGEAHDNSGRVFGVLRRVAQDNNNNAISGTSDAPILKELQRIGTSAIVQLVDRPWFHRLWTVQEVLLARDAEIICGKERMPWTEFTRAIEVIYERYFAPGRGMSLLDQGRFESFKVLTRAKDEMLLNHTPHERFQNLLLMLRRRKCKDDVDKVYGLSALVRSPDGKQIIEADYRIPHEQVYAMATHDVIQNTNQLDILSASGSVGLFNGYGQLMPSWVGDFILRERRPPWSFRFIHGTKFRNYPSNLKAKRGDIRFERSQLILKGYFVDEIEEVAPVLNDFDPTTIRVGIDHVKTKARGIDREVRSAMDLIYAFDGSFFAGLARKCLNKTLPLALASFEGWANFTANRVELTATYRWYLQSVQTLLDWERLAGLEITPAYRLYADDEYNEEFGLNVNPNSEPWMRQRTEEYWQTITGGSLLLTSSSSSSLPRGTTTPSSSSLEVKASRDAFKNFDKMLAITRKRRLMMGISNEHMLEHLINFLSYLAGQSRTPSEFPQLLAHAQGRCLARTVTGNLVLVRDTAQRGDHLAFCRGARVPLVLRRLAGWQHYRYVCESYSHRLQGMPLGEDRWQEIRIV